MALVTGGGTGLGRATCLALAGIGCDVAVNYSRSEGEARATADAIRAVGHAAIAVQADVSDDASVRQMVETITSELGGLDILVNNAGTTRYTPLEDLDAITDDVWQSILGVNLLGPFYCVRAALPHLRRSGRGKVINTASNSAFRPTGSSLPYMASKAALVSLTRSLARALAPEVQVNAIAPGWLDTPWLDKHLPQDVRTRVHESASFAGLEDVARTIVLLATTDSISGAVVTIDRGASL